MGKPQTVESAQAAVGADVEIEDAVAVMGGPVGLIMLIPAIAALITIPMVVTGNFAIVGIIVVATIVVVAPLVLSLRLLILANTKQSVYIFRGSRWGARADELLTLEQRPLEVERSASLGIHEEVILLGKSYRLARPNKQDFDNVIGGNGRGST